MRTLIQKLRSAARSWPGQQDGVAAVEFALIMPFMLLLYFGSMEGSSLFTADKRIDSISATVGDLISQWDPKDGKIATSTLNDYFAASAGLINPYSSTGLKIVVSLVEVKSDGTTKVLWSQGYGGGTAWTVNNPYTPLTATSQMNQVARGGCIVASETSYSYKPLLGQVFTSALNLKHSNYFLPRYGAAYPIDLQTTSLAANACTA
jgi:Flp pilus assembly protein TadG